MNYQFIKKSSNSKVGPIPVTNSHRGTCPDTCPLAGDGGCYAEAGYYTRMNWDKIDSGERGGSWNELCDSVSKLPEGQLWRHNVSGDLPHHEGRIDRFELNQLIIANENKRGFTYTHHDLRITRNLAAVIHANRHGFAVNVSCDNDEEIEQAMIYDLPAVTVIPEDSPKVSFSGFGHKIVTCPAVNSDKVTCSSCGMCADSKRDYVIGFPAHGARKRTINVRLESIS